MNARAFSLAWAAALASAAVFAGCGGSHDDAARDTSAADSRRADAADVDARPMDTQPGDSAPQDTAGHDTGGHDIGGHDTAGHDTGGHDTGGHDIGGHDTGGHDTAGHDTGGHDIGGHDTAGHDTAGHDVPASPGTTATTIASGEDAVTTYLLAGFGSAWNGFHGATVYLGRHWDAAHVSYHTGLRFTGVDVPAGATITSASLTISPTNEVDRSNKLWINVYAELAADSAAFDLTWEARRPDQRMRTSAHVDHWLVRCNDGCTDDTEYDCPQRRLDCWARDTRFVCPKDLSELVQEVVDLSDWRAGNALTLLLVNAATDQDGADYRDSRSFTGVDAERGAGFSPTLTISYTLESGAGPR